MAVYTIQRDLPWQEPRPQSHVRSSYTTTTTSHYSEDEDSEIAEIPPLRVNKPQIKQARHSRLPILKQVRSIINKAPLANSVQNDRDLESARQAFRAAYETPTYRSSEVPSAPRSESPVSVLHDDDLYPSSPPQLDYVSVSPVSPIAASASRQPAREHKMGPLQVHVPAMPRTPAPFVVKRKPAPARIYTSPPDYPSSPPSNDYESHDFVIKGSHFSWTTGVPSPTSLRPSYDVRCSINSYQTSGHHSLPEYDPIPDSRFSWTTVGSSLRQPSLHQPSHVESPPPSPPPPIPTKYTTPPVRSILSRHRPVQRMDYEQRAPPRKVPGAVSILPITAKPKLIVISPPRSRDASRNRSPKRSPETGTAKKLPPPPDLSQRTHLESLQRAEEDKIHQRGNIQRVIAELSKVENASPMEVPFSHVRDAKRRLIELHALLSEIELEEREIGIAISRARRKEGEEEGLWVRRVTG